MTQQAVITGSRLKDQQVITYLLCYELCASLPALRKFDTGRTVLMLGGQALHTFDDHPPCEALSGCSQSIQRHRRTLAQLQPAQHIKYSSDLYRRECTSWWQCLVLVGRGLCNGTHPSCTGSLCCMLLHKSACQAQR